MQILFVKKKKKTIFQKYFNEHIPFFQRKSLSFKKFLQPFTKKSSSKNTSLLKINIFLHFHYTLLQNSP